VSPWDVDISHTVRKTITVQASSAAEAEEIALTTLPPAKYLDGWVSDQEFEATAFDAQVPA
jgi:hypothetical protein